MLYAKPIKKVMVEIEPKAEDQFIEEKEADELCLELLGLLGPIEERKKYNIQVYYNLIQTSSVE
jgi:hypothetical protein